MTVWIIDDNEAALESWSDLLEDANPSAILVKFSSFREAVIRGGSFPDVAIVDITAVCGSDFYQCLDHMQPFMDRHPGCTWVVASALGDLAKRYFEDYAGPAVLHVIDVSDSELVARLVRGESF